MAAQEGLLQVADQARFVIADTWTAFDSGRQSAHPHSVFMVEAINCILQLIDCEWLLSFLPRAHPPLQVLPCVWAQFHQRLKKADQSVAQLQNFFPRIPFRSAGHLPAYPQTSGLNAFLQAYFPKPLGKGVGDDASLIF
jgi:hypothetical protein